MPRDVCQGHKPITSILKDLSYPALYLCNARQSLSDGYEWLPLLHCHFHRPTGLVVLQYLPARPRTHIPKTLTKDRFRAKEACFYTSHLT
jgi:hypothetical protein